MSQRDRVFISSARGALDPYRDAARDACFRLGLVPVRMEDFSPDRLPPAEVCRRELDGCDAVILLLAHRYGSRPPEGGRSYTELEYEWALRRPSLPLLIFIVDPEFPWAPSDVDRGDDVEALRRFTTRATSSHVVRRFRDVPAFREDLIVALRDVELRPAPASEPRASRKVPAPPAFHAVPPYIGSAPFIGRVDHLETLDRWAAGTDPIMVVEAIGGTGKSALTWEWARHRAPSGFAGHLWWSFYEGSASITRFLSEALTYVSGHPFEEIRRLDRIDLAEHLLEALRDRPYLLILDGFERLLAAYHRFDPSKLRDDEVEPAKRSLIEPHALEVVQALTTAGPSKILISTRLMPDALEGRFGQQVPGVQHIRLPGLTDADALTLLTKLGVSGTPQNVAAFFQKLDNHPLLIGIVAGLVRDYRRAPNQFDRWLTDLNAGSALSLSQLPLNQRRAHILAVAFEGLPVGHRRVLGWISVLAGAVDWATLEAINPFRTEDSNSSEAEGQLDAALTDLEERGLLWWDRASNTYDLHPIVRAYVYDQLDSADRVRANERVHRYFDALPPENPETATSVEDLRQTIIMFRALVGAERISAAGELWKDRLSAPLLKELGACSTVVELLTSPATALPRHLRIDLSIALSLLGRNTDALEHDLAILADTLEQGDAFAVTTALSRAANSFLDNGNYFCGTRFVELESTLAAAAKIQTEWGLLIVCADLALERGELGEASKFLDECENSEDDDPWVQGGVLCLRLWIAFHERTLTVKDLDYVGAKLHTWLDRVDLANLRYEFFLRSADFRNALSAAQEVERLERSAGRDAIPADIALAFALLGQWEEASHAIELAIGMESRVSPEQFPYYTLAKALQKLDRFDEAARYAIEAYRTAWGDGPPYYDYWDLEDAKEILAELDVAPPELPIVDPATAVVPMEREIWAYIEKVKRSSGSRDG